MSEKGLGGNRGRAVRADFDRVASSSGLPVPELEFDTHLPVIGSVRTAPSGEVLVRRREYTETVRAYWRSERRALNTTWTTG